MVLALGRLEGGDGDVRVCDAGLAEVLGLLVVAAFGKLVGFRCERVSRKDQLLSYLVKVDKHAARSRVHVQSLIQVLPEVDLADNRADRV